DPHPNASRSLTDVVRRDPSVRRAAFSGKPNAQRQRSNCWRVRKRWQRRRGASEARARADDEDRRRYGNETYDAHNASEPARAGRIASMGAVRNPRERTAARLLGGKRRQIPDVGKFAGIFEVDSNDFAVGIEVENNAGFDFLRADRANGTEPDIERV